MKIIEIVSIEYSLLTTSVHMALMDIRQKVLKCILEHERRFISPLLCLSLIISIVMGLFLPFVAYGETSQYAEDTRIAYFKQQLISDTVLPKMKLIYYDSLMFRLPEEMPKLLLGKAMVLRDINQPKYLKEAINLYETDMNGFRQRE